MHGQKFDASTAIGLAIAATLVASAIMLGGTPLAFLDLPSTLIVIGGTFALTTACFSIPEVMKSQSLFLRTIFYTNDPPGEAAIKMLEYAENARKNGILALQNFIASEPMSPFLLKGLTMVIDGLPIESAEQVLKQDILSMVDRHNKGVAVFRKSAEISPAMGLIGTLIGLVQMLGNLDDPSNIGPAMAVALLTTLYGAMLAFMVFTPVAAKLERITKEEVMVNTVYLKGVVSIAKQENPRQLETLINTILPPDKRIKYFD